MTKIWSSVLSFPCVILNKIRFDIFKSRHLLISVKAVPYILFMKMLEKVRLLEQF